MYIINYTLHINHVLVCIYIYIQMFLMSFSSTIHNNINMIHNDKTKLDAYHSICTGTLHVTWCSTPGTFTCPLHQTHVPYVPYTKHMGCWNKHTHEISCCIIGIMPNCHFKCRSKILTAWFWNHPWTTLSCFIGRVYHIGRKWSLFGGKTPMFDPNHNVLFFGWHSTVKHAKCWLVTVFPFGIWLVCVCVYRTL